MIPLWLRSVLVVLGAIFLACMFGYLDYRLGKMDVQINKGDKK